MTNVFKTSLKAFAAGFMGAFIFMAVEGDLTWSGVLLAICAAAVIGLAFGAMKACNREKKSE